MSCSIHVPWLFATTSLEKKKCEDFCDKTNNTRKITKVLFGVFWFSLFNCFGNFHIVLSACERLYTTASPQNVMCKLKTFHIQEKFARNDWKNYKNIAKKAWK